MQSNFKSTSSVPHHSFKAQVPPLRINRTGKSCENLDFTIFIVPQQRANCVVSVSSSRKRPRNRRELLAVMALCTPHPRRSVLPAASLDREKYNKSVPSDSVSKRRYVHPNALGCKRYSPKGNGSVVFRSGSGSYPEIHPVRCRHSLPFDHHI